MKTRNGFVSNSSSTSFYMAYYGKTPTPKEITHAFGAHTDSIAERLLMPIAELMLHGKHYGTLDELAQEEHDESAEAFLVEPDMAEICALFTGGFTVLRVEVGNQEDTYTARFLYEYFDRAWYSIKTPTLVIIPDPWT